MKFIKYLLILVDTVEKDRVIYNKCKSIKKKWK